MLAKVTSANRERTLDDPRSPTLALANSRGGHPRPRHQSMVRVANRRRLASRGRPQFHLSGIQPQSRHRLWSLRRFAIHRHENCIDTRLSSYHWPAFNVADSAITIGAVLIIIDVLFFHKHQAPEVSNRQAS